MLSSTTGLACPRNDPQKMAWSAKHVCELSHNSAHPQNQHCHYCCAAHATSEMGQTTTPRQAPWSAPLGLFGWRPWLGEEANPVTENLMNAPTSSSAGAEKLLSSVEAEISRLVEQQKTRNPPAQIEADPESIKAAIARLTSNSIDGLEGLVSER